MIKLNNHGRTPERTRMRYITPGSRRTSDCQPLRHQLPNHTPGPWLPGPIPSSFPSHLGRPEGRQAELKDFYELALPGWGLVPEWASLNNRGSTHSQAEQNACEQNTPSVPNLPPPRLLETALLAGEKKKKPQQKLVDSGISCVRRRSDKASWNYPATTGQAAEGQTRTNSVFCPRRTSP